MISVKLAPEPPAFDAEVRTRGLSAISEMVGRGVQQETALAEAEEALCPRGAHSSGSVPAVLSSGALPAMLQAYERSCAYLSMYIHHATGSPTVDHVLPKSYSWRDVYESANYRLCAAIENSKKGVLQDLVDPFAIGPAWFALNLNTFHVERGAATPQGEWGHIDASLPMLNHRLCVSEREEYVRCYRLGPGPGGFDLAHLRIRAPFIELELRRQGQLVRAGRLMRQPRRTRQLRGFVRQLLRDARKLACAFTSSPVRNPMSVHKFDAQPAALRLSSTATQTRARP